MSLSSQKLRVIGTLFCVILVPLGYVLLSHTSENPQVLGLWSARYTVVLFVYAVVAVIATMAATGNRLIAKAINFATTPIKRSSSKILVIYMILSLLLTWVILGIFLGSVTFGFWWLISGTMLICMTVLDMVLVIIVTERDDRKEVVANVVLVFSSIGATLTAGEFGLRLADRSGVLDRAVANRVITSGTWLMKFDEQLGWRYIPDWQGVYAPKHGDFVTEVKINTHGLLDREIDYQKPENTYRVLLLGDSFTAAVHVPLGRTAAKVLEDRLNSSTGRPQAFEVINGGVGAYGTDQELLFYQYEGHKYQPDLVLLMFYVGNDVRNNSHVLEVRYRAGAVYKPFFTLEDGEVILWRQPINAVYGAPRFSSPILQWLQVKSLLFRWTSPTLKQIGNWFAALGSSPISQASPAQQSSVPRSLALDHYVFSNHYTWEWNEAWEITEALILKLRDEVESQGSRFGVVIVNSYLQVDETIWQEILSLTPETNALDWDVTRPDRKLIRFLEDYDIEYLWMLPRFKWTEQTGVFPYYPNDHHWTVKGHRLAADLMFDWLSTSDLTP